jgi:signal transduction histidine kinase
MLLGKFKVSARGDQAREMEEMNGLIQQAIDESRTLTFELSPPVLYELGLPSAVDWLAEQMQRRHGVKMRVHSTLANGQLPIDVRVLLFQAIRELLTNIIKHARARNAEISLQCDGSKAEVIVSDDGIGTRNLGSSPRETTSGGFGLFSIRTRVERLGGSFVMESRRRRGTRVTLVVPIPQEDEKAGLLNGEGGT